MLIAGILQHIPDLVRPFDADFEVLRMDFSVGLLGVFPILSYNTVKIESHQDYYLPRHAARAYEYHLL
jgi:hypothetical protein